MRKSDHDAAVGIYQAKIVNLDAENERQAERILDLEAEVGSYQNQNQCSAPTVAPGPHLNVQGAVAILAVAQMLENKAETLAIRVGDDVGSYVSLCTEAHNLRSIVGDDELLEEEATELYGVLSS